MDHLLSREDFLDIQANLYDAMEQILKEGKIDNTSYKLVGEKNNYLPPIHDKKMIATKQWLAGMNNTANVNSWLHEITSLKDNIIQELLVCLAYNKIFKEYEKNSNAKLKNIFNERKRYFKLAIYDLYTFRENLAYLIYEMFDRPKVVRYIGEKNTTKYLSKKDIDFHTINNELKNTNYKNLKNTNHDEFKTINEDEFKIIKEIFKSLGEKKCNDIFELYRHPFIHRSSPGIDCSPLKIFDFEKIYFSSIDLESAESKELLKKDYKDMTKEELKKRDKISSKLANLAFNNTKQKFYIPLSTKKEEEASVTFEKAEEDVLYLLKLFLKGFKKLLKSVEILKVEVKVFY